MLNANRKKKNTILSENILGKFVFHETKKVNSLRFNCEPFEKFRCFVSGILLVNMLNLSVKKLKKYNFKQKPLGKLVFHKTKKVNNLKGFPYGKHNSQTQNSIKQLRGIFT